MIQLNYAFILLGSAFPISLLVPLIIALVGIVRHRTPSKKMLERYRGGAISIKFIHDTYVRQVYLIAFGYLMVIVNTVVIFFIGEYQGVGEEWMHRTYFSSIAIVLILFMVHVTLVWRKYVVKKFILGAY